MIPLLLGTLLIARHKRSGWLIAGLGDLAFILYGLLTGQILFALDVVFLVIRARAYLSWGKIPQESSL